MEEINSKELKPQIGAFAMLLAPSVTTSVTAADLGDRLLVNSEKIVPGINNRTFFCFRNVFHLLLGSVTSYSHTCGHSAAGQYRN